MILVLPRKRVAHGLRNSQSLDGDLDGDLDNKDLMVLVLALVLRLL